MPKPVIADLVQPLWQHVLQEAAQEFVSVEARTAPAVEGAVLVPDDDARLIDGKDAALGYGYAKHVAREVGEPVAGVTKRALSPRFNRSCKAATMASRSFLSFSASVSLRQTM